MRIFPAVAMLLLIAAAPEPAAPVNALDDALLASMKSGHTASLSARTAKLLPVVRATHDLETMASKVVGPAWASAPASDRAALIDTFAKHSALSYAANFASFAGERFVVDPAIVARGAYKVVRTKIVASSGGAALDYKLRGGAEGWRIVDIYADGISQIAVQRSEFASTIAAGGVAALVRKLEAADATRLKGH